jgi:hypothetical protein
MRNLTTRLRLGTQSNREDIPWHPPVPKHELYKPETQGGAHESCTQVWGPQSVDFSKLRIEFCCPPLKPTQHPPGNRVSAEAATTLCFAHDLA